MLLMKKIVSSFLALCMAVTASAEGFQVNNFSARQMGMGHTGAALELGAESMLFNPGALGMSGFSLDASAGMTAIFSEASARIDGTKYVTDNKVSTPFNVSAAFRIYDNLYAGICISTPYGSSIKWGDNWAAAILNQSVDIKVFDVQPTVSWRVTPNLSVGAGLQIAWGSVNLNKGLVTDGSYNALIGALGLPDAMRLDGITPASVNLDGHSETAVGYNLGAFWKINNKVSVGASFRSKLDMKVKKGDATVTYANEAARTVLGTALDNLNATNFAASLPCPWVTLVGVAYKPIKPLTLAFDLQINGWSDYETLDVEFDRLEGFDQHLVKNYHTALTYHLGAQYALTHRFDLRAGLMVDCSPCDKNHYNPETPGQTRVEPTLGFSFRPVPAFSIDLSAMYVVGCGQDGATGVYEDFIGASYPALGIPAHGSIRGDYRLHAFSAGIGLSYRF